MAPKNLSTGNRQKVVIVRALQNDVPVYLVDEPTRGLDPLVQQEFERIIREYRERGHTIFLSTHVLSEAEALCDRVGILRDGRLVAVETVTGLKKARVRRFSVMFDGHLPRDDELSNASFIERNGSELRFEVSGSVDSIVKTLGRYQVTDLFIEQPTLEDVFLRYYGEDKS